MSIKIIKAPVKVEGASEPPKVLNLANRKRTASKVLRKGSDPQSQMKANTIAHSMKDAGVVGASVDGSKLSGEELLNQYITLDSIGASMDTICAILNISRPSYAVLARKSRALYVSNLSEAGVMGTIGTAFHRIDVASKRAMALLASLDDKDLRSIDAARALVAFETQKVELLVRTGAVKVKHRIEISSEIEPDGVGDPSLMSGASAMRILQMLQLQDGTYVSAIDTTASDIGL